jgi:hypothetical protein
MVVPEGQQLRSVPLASNLISASKLYTPLSILHSPFFIPHSSFPIPHSLYSPLT